MDPLSQESGAECFSPSRRYKDEASFGVELRPVITIGAVLLLKVSTSLANDRFDDREEAVDAIES